MFCLLEVSLSSRIKMRFIWLLIFDFYSLPTRNSWTLYAFLYKMLDDLVAIVMITVARNQDRPITFLYGNSEIGLDRAGNLRVGPSPISSGRSWAGPALAVTTVLLISTSGKRLCGSIMITITLKPINSYTHLLFSRPFRDNKKNQRLCHSICAFSDQSSKVN